MEDEDEVCVLVPPRACHLRGIRLLAAEAAGRAGFDVSQLDDLRIAVDELCYTLMDASDQRLLVRIVAQPGQVVVRGSARCRTDGRPPQLPSVSELIVDVVTDHYTFDVDGDHLSFVIVKRALERTSA